jgi:hypothetical protein
LCAAVYDLGELGLELVDLPLNQQQRLIFSFFSKQSPKATQKKPDQKSQAAKDEEDKKKWISRFHYWGFVELQKPQGVFQDLAEFSHLGCPHRSFFERRGKVAVDASLQIPL